ncbi:MAG TPA: FHA domain-containing protein [Bryobacteraceae bacterium]|nr:FHA domain-containing protein [Bryobacteraceae bacterium]
MEISSVIEKLGRAIFETPFGGARISKDAPELAEIRLAVLDAIKSKSHRAGGKTVFPFNLVRIHLRGVPEAQAAVFHGEFLAKYFSGEIRAGLTRAGYRFPDDFQAEIRSTPKLPEKGEEWLWVETATKDLRAESSAAGARKTARLSVLQGVANQAELGLTKARTNIGRTTDVYRVDGPSRRNDLAFTGDSEINRTVSREHAHILYSKKTGEYRLLNDRFHKPGQKSDAGCGVWIIRDGISQPVHHNARGTVLKPGDEIHLGRAVIRFQLR